MAYRTLTAIYDSKNDAQDAEKRLKEAKVDASHIKITSQGDVNEGGANQGWWSSVKSAFGGHEDNTQNYHAYGEAMTRGAYLLTADVDDAQVDESIRILEGSKAVDFDQRQGEWRNQGWTGAAATGDMAAGMTGATAGATRSAADARLNDQDKIQLAEERLVVGKREVERGGVRVRSYVVERPVNEQVSLREERVTIERSPVNQVVSGSADNLFQERTIETTETAEQAVVGKQTVITEELNLRKDVEQRTETISDTVRHTEVDIDDTRREGETEDAWRTRTAGRNTGLGSTTSGTTRTI